MMILVFTFLVLLFRRVLSSDPSRQSYSALDKKLQILKALPKKGQAMARFHWALAVLASISLFLASVVHAADITVLQPATDSKPALVLVSGEFLPGDEKEFTRKVLDIDSAVVTLASPGGNLYAGIQIGKAIRLKQFSTLVIDDSTCASACALAWLGGIKRMMQPHGQVGFHAASITKDGAAKESGVGNALAGSYLNQLGLPDSAVAYITSPPPDAIQWLTAEDANKIGIDVSVVGGNASSGITAPKPERREYKISDGVDLFGQDLRDMPLRHASLASCQDACDAEPACRAFTFNRKSSVCFLKDGANFSVGYEYAVGGYLPMLADNIHASELKIHQHMMAEGKFLQTSVPETFEECIKACDSENDCRAFFYDQKKHLCNMLSTYEGLTTAKSMVAGTK